MFANIDANDVDMSESGKRKAESGKRKAGESDARRLNENDCRTEGVHNSVSRLI